MTYADYYVTAINVRSSLHSPDFFFFALGVINKTKRSLSCYREILRPEDVPRSGNC